MRRSGWLLVGVVALVGVLFLAVFPARAYLAQGQERRRLAADVEATAARNRALEARAQLLGTDAEVERLARAHYNLVKPGEEAYAIVPPPRPPARPGPRRPSRPAASWWSRVWHEVTSVL